MPKDHEKKHPGKHEKPGKKHEPEGKEGKDLRRAYEHLGRVETLRLVGGSSAGHQFVNDLVQYAERALRDGVPSKDAAEALRAAEHASFAVLMEQGERQTHVADPRLAEAIQSELRKLKEKIDERREEEKPLHHLQQAFLDAAEQAYRLQHYRQALEWARGAEALSHVHEGPKKPKALKAPDEKKRKKLAA
jgi:hypothetical protein